MEPRLEPEIRHVYPVRLILILVLAVGALVLVVFMMRRGGSTVETQKPVPASVYGKEGSIPLVTSPQETWPNVVVKAHSNSKVVAVPGGMHIVFAGSGLIVHNVYSGGSPECTSSGPSTNCKDGDVSSYVENTTDTDRVVPYAFNYAGKLP